MPYRTSGSRPDTAGSRSAAVREVDRLGYRGRAGDQDEGCLEPALMLKRTIPTAGLAVLPRTGHTANLEEPHVFNRVVDAFLAAVARGAWHPRDPRSRSASVTGMS